MSQLNTSLKLPCGQVIPNRLAKAAMSENMARNQQPEAEFINAYRMWARGGAGLIITGNVMIDSNHLGEPDNVVIEKGKDISIALKEWAGTTKDTNSKLWMQINHPGKQSPKFLNKTPVAPSSIAMTSQLKSMFNPPVELSESEIYDIIDRFAYAAQMAKECGFDGVQIHGAHGYLVSQFLSPLHNKRTDQFGGTLDNRMRFLIEVYTNIRHKVGSSFPIGIKLNSADFSKGGFSNAEAIIVAKKLSDLKVDLIEISGGSYESPAMTGQIKDSTKKREAYFLDYTKEIRKAITSPLMVTGGFRTRKFMEDVLQNNELDLIGLARPLAINPLLCKMLLNGDEIYNQIKKLTSGFKKIDEMFPLEVIWYTYQIHRMGKNKMPNPNASVFLPILKMIHSMGFESIKRMRA